MSNLLVNNNQILTVGGHALELGSTENGIEAEELLYMSNNSSIWEQGSINSSSASSSPGENTNINKNYRIRTKGFLSRNLKKIVVGSGYNICIYSYDENNNIIGSFNKENSTYNNDGQNWLTGIIFLNSIPKNYKIRLIVKNSQNTTNIYPNEGENIYLYYYTTGEGYSKGIPLDKNKIIIDEKIWEQGSLSSGEIPGNDTDLSNYDKRIRSIKLKKELFNSISVVNGYEYLVYVWNNTNNYLGFYNGNTITSSATWNNTVISLNNIPDNYFIRLLVKKSDDTNITPNNSYDKIIFHSLTDVTLSVLGEPADAKIVGDRIGDLAVGLEEELKEFRYDEYGRFSWERYNWKVSDGTGGTIAYRCRTNYIPSDIRKIYVDPADGIKITFFGWREDGTLTGEYLGTWSDLGWSKTSEDIRWYNGIITLPKLDYEYKVKLEAGYTSSSNPTGMSQSGSISLEEAQIIGSKIKYRRYTDSSLSKFGEPAEAKITGQKLEELYEAAFKQVQITGWEGGTFNTDGTENYTKKSRIRLLDSEGNSAFYVKAGTVIGVNSGYKFNVAEYSYYATPTDFTLSHYKSFNDPTNPYTISQDCWIKIHLAKNNDAVLWTKNEIEEESDEEEVQTLTEAGEQTLASVYINFRLLSAEDSIKVLENAIYNSNLPKTYPLNGGIPINAIEYHRQWDEMVEDGFCEKIPYGMEKNGEITPWMDYDPGTANLYPKESEDPNELVPKWPLYYYHIDHYKDYMGPLTGQGDYAIHRKGSSNYTDIFNRPKILITSGIHGSEKGTPNSLYDFIKSMWQQPEMGELLTKFEWFIAPLCNPWGYSHSWLKDGNLYYIQGWHGEKTNYTLVENTLENGYTGGVRFVCNDPNIAINPSGCDGNTIAWDPNRDFSDHPFNYNERIYGFQSYETRYLRDRILKNYNFDIVIDMHQAQGETSCSFVAFEGTEGSNTAKERRTKLYNLVAKSAAKTDIAMSLEFKKPVGIQYAFPWSGIPEATFKNYTGGIQKPGKYTPLGGSEEDTIVGFDNNDFTPIPYALCIETSTKCTPYSGLGGQHWFNNVANKYGNTFCHYFLFDFLNNISQLDKEWKEETLVNKTKDFYEKNFVNLNNNELWELKGLSVSTGEANNLLTRCKTDFLTPDFVLAGSNTKILIFAWDSNENYQGCWSGNGWTKNTSNIKWFFSNEPIYFSQFNSDYKFKIVVATVYDLPIDEDNLQEISNKIQIQKYTDTELNKKGKIADAYTTGRAIYRTKDRDANTAASYTYWNVATAGYSSDNPVAPADMPLNTYTYASGALLAGFNNDLFTLSTTAAYFVWCWASLYNTSIREYIIIGSNIFYFGRTTNVNTNPINWKNALTIIDNTLTLPEAAADAETVGNIFKQINQELSRFGMEELLWKTTPFVGSSAGLTYTINNNNTVTVNGTTTGISWLTFYLNSSSLPDWVTIGQEYHARINSSSGQIKLQIWEYREGASSSSRILSTTTHDTFHFSEDAIGANIRVAVTSSEVDINNETVIPSITIAATSSEKNPLKLAMFGDSIMRGIVNPTPTTSKNNDDNIPNGVARELGIITGNFGIGSIGWLNSSTAENRMPAYGYLKAFVEGNENYYGNYQGPNISYNGNLFIGKGTLEDYNAVLLAFGANDRVYPLGTLDEVKVYDNDSYNPDDPSNDYGAENMTIIKQIYRCVRYLRSQVPNLPIILVGPYISYSYNSSTHQASSHTTGDGTYNVMVYNQWTKAQYAELLRQFAEYYGCQYIDMHNMPRNPFDLTQSLTNGVHPTAACYHEIAKYVAGHLGII